MVKKGATSKIRAISRKMIAGPALADVEKAIPARLRALSHPNVDAIRNVVDSFPKN